MDTEGKPYIKISMNRFWNIHKDKTTEQEGEWIAKMYHFLRYEVERYGGNIEIVKVDDKEQ